MNPKQIVGEKALEYIQDGMIIGLGTGSTVYWFIVKLGELVRKGLDIKGVATSKNTEELAESLGIPLLNISEVNYIDVTIDGADEVNDKLELTKGGGGALLREKMVASISKKLIIIVDDSKYVDSLGKFPLPVEIVQFGWKNTSKQLESLGCKSVLRKIENKVFLTDNNNFIVDCYFENIDNATELQNKINMIPGVVENGLFTNMTNLLLIGDKEGNIKVMLSPN